MHLPLLPFQLVPVDLETDALGLYNMQRLDIISDLESRLRLLDQVGKEILGCLRRRNPLSVQLDSVQHGWGNGRSVVQQSLFPSRGEIKRRVRSLGSVLRRPVDMNNFLRDGVYNRY